MSTFCGIRPLVLGLALVLTLFVADSRSVTLCPPAFTFTSEAAAMKFGYSVASAGDVNNDGYPDIIVGARGGWVYVFSGLNGDTLWVFYQEALQDHFGGSVSGAGDVNNDGHGDFIVGADQNDAGGTSAGRAYVFSGLDGDTLYVFTGEDSGDHFGGSVSGAGDVNNDRYDDMIVGAYWDDAGGPKAGRAYVFSGLDGDTLYVYTGENSYDHLGVSVSGAGDVNGDGYDDLIVGADGNDVSAPNAGRAYVFCGQHGDTLHVFDGEGSHDAFGFSISGAGDVNNDGYDDLIIGEWSNDVRGTNTGRAYVFSGLDGDILHVFTGEARNDQLGWSVSGAGDVDNDGYDDLVVGAWFGGGDHRGRAYVFSGWDGSSLHLFTGEATEAHFGWSVSGAGDVNHDSYDDIIVGSTGSTAIPVIGRAYVFTLGNACTSCCLDLRGNTNGDLDDSIDLADLTYFVDYLFKSGPPPPCPNEGDVDGSGAINVADLAYLVDYLFFSGPTPPPCP